jgi:hypothetical protein
MTGIDPDDRRPVLDLRCLHRPCSTRSSEMSLHRSDLFAGPKLHSFLARLSVTFRLKWDDAVAHARSIRRVLPILACNMNTDPSRSISRCSTEQRCSVCRVEAPNVIRVGAVEYLLGIGCCWRALRLRARGPVWRRGRRTGPLSWPQWQAIKHRPVRPCGQPGGDDRARDSAAPRPPGGPAGCCTHTSSRSGLVRTAGTDFSRHLSETRLYSEIRVPVGTPSNPRIFTEGN